MAMKQCKHLDILLSREGRFQLRFQDSGQVESRSLRPRIMWGDTGPPSDVLKDLDRSRRVSTQFVLFCQMKEGLATEHVIPMVSSDGLMDLLAFGCVQIGDASPSDHAFHLFAQEILSCRRRNFLFDS